MAEWPEERPVDIEGVVFSVQEALFPLRGLGMDGECIAPSTFTNDLQ